MKKKLKGMTLVEVLVALAVFTIISALLASAVAGVCNIVRKTDRLNKKISDEAPQAEQRNGGALVTKPDGSADSMEIVINGNTYTVPVEKYVVTDEKGIDDGGDFKYFEVQETT